MYIDPIRGGNETSKKIKKKTLKLKLGINNTFK